MKPLSFSYDHETDVLTIEGEKYDGDLFRALANGGPRWTPFQFRRRGGVLELQELESLRQIYCPPPKPGPERGG